MKKIAISFLIVLFGIIKCHSQIYLSNNTKEPVWVSIAMYYNQKTYKGWISQGWWKVSPNEKKIISGFIGENDIFCYYAYSTSKQYTGVSNILVDPINKFSIKNCTMDYVYEDNPTYQWKKFRQVKMNKKPFQSKYTIELNY